MALPERSAIAICPGEGCFTRKPGKVAGSTDGRGSSVEEWMWAQGAMFGYFYADFKMRYPTASFVLWEAQYARLITGITKADQLLRRMEAEFRRDMKAGGLLRPDILGFCASAPAGPRIVLELLEVTTVGQASKTFKEDVKYKLYKLDQIIGGLFPDVQKAFSLASYSVTAAPSKWRPYPLYQRIVPLPLRTDPVTGKVSVEWICFQPTFNRNWPDGIDGLLLYEIHSLPLESKTVPDEVLKRLRDEERRRRLATQTAYGMTLTPWITQDYYARNHADRDALLLVATLAGAALLVLAAVYLAPVVAGLELGALIEAGVAVGEATAGSLALIGRGLTATLETSGQWVSALGKHILIPAAP